MLGWVATSIVCKVEIVQIKMNRVDYLDRYMQFFLFSGNYGPKEYKFV